MTLETWDKEHYFHVRETETNKAEIDTKTWRRRKDVWFDIFGTESLTLPGSQAAATRKQSLLIFRTTESDHCVQGQAGQAATCDQAALAVSTPSTAQLTPVKTKTPSLLMIADSVQIPANTIVTTASITALDTITRLSGNIAVKG